MEQEIRWRQKLGELTKAYGRLEEALKLSDFSDLEKDGVIQRFEFTFELAWKTMKDYLEEQGVIDIANPKKVLRKAFEDRLFSDDELWLDMQNDRNRLSHLYKKEMSDKIFENIKNKYSKAFAELLLNLEKQ